MDPKLDHHHMDAEATILAITPRAPAAPRHDDIWPVVLSQHIVRAPDVNKICAKLRRNGQPVFLDWEDRGEAPKDNYHMQQPTP